MINLEPMHRPLLQILRSVKIPLILCSITMRSLSAMLSKVQVFQGLYLVHRALQAATNGMIEHILGCFILCSSPIGVKVMPGEVHMLAVI
jgi:hypothetical protein